MSRRAARLVHRAADHRRRQRVTQPRDAGWVTTLADCRHRALHPIGYFPHWGTGGHGSGCMAYVVGPYPLDPDRPVALTPSGEQWVLEFQIDNGLAVDRVLGPQTWIVLANQNQERLSR